MYKIKNNWSYVLPKAKNFYRRQDFDFNFFNGAIYAVHKKFWEKKLIGNKHIYYKMPK